MSYSIRDARIKLYFDTEKSLFKKLWKHPKICKRQLQKNKNKAFLKYFSNKLLTKGFFQNAKNK